MDLARIAGLVAPYLDPKTCHTLAHFGQDWQYLATYGSIPYGSGIRGGLHRRRSRAFGQPDVNRSASHDSIPAP